MKTYLYFFTTIFLLSGCFSGSAPEQQQKIQNQAAAPKTEAKLTTGRNSSQQFITSLPIPKYVTFAGVAIPVDRDDVREALESELMVNTFRQSHTLAIIKEVERWRPFVVQTLKAQNVPEDFLYLAVVESEFDNNACSYAGAMGMWQLMEETAKDYQLKINKDVDMRRDPKLATEAAGKFLKKAYASLNDWVLVAAAYNVGVKGMKNRLEDQKVNSFFDLHLNSETARYVYRIIAFKLILEDPGAYGYFVPNNEKYTPYNFTTIKVTDDIDNLVDFSKKHKTTYKKLRQLNPWFNNTSDFRLKVKKHESYEIRIPS
jgi:membrane-bound lytic murein transglycosylase D